MKWLDPNPSPVRVERGNPLFGYIRTRQLEGSLPGPKEEGVWAANSMRVDFGWGLLPDRIRPQSLDRGVWPVEFPDDLDDEARPYRVMFYRRVRSAAECRYWVRPEAPFALIVAVRISQDWHEPGAGVFEDPNHYADRLRGSHSFGVVNYSPRAGLFLFPNSWETDWGIEGYGLISPGYIDARLVESYTFWGIGSTFPQGRGVIGPVRSPLNLAHDRHGVFCIHDGGDEERFGWATFVEKDKRVELEDLYVKPAFRGRGHGRALFAAASRYARHRGKPLMAWPTFADSGPENLDALHGFFARRRLYLTPARVRWAAFKAVPTPHPKPAPVELPPKPADAGPIVAPFDAPWPTAAQQAAYIVSAITAVLDGMDRVEADGLSDHDAYRRVLAKVADLGPTPGLIRAVLSLADPRLQRLCGVLFFVFAVAAGIDG